MRTNPRLVSGRVRELAVLRAERQRTTLGELRVALVLGDAGLGKTRLATELVPHDHEYAVGLNAHRCLFKGMPPLGPWVDTLDLRANSPETNRACRVCGSGLGGLPALARRGDTAHDAASCAEALRYHLVEWIPALLATASVKRPIVMVLDDSHRSDDAVWEMLLRLSRDCPESRLFVLATARPAELARKPKALEVLHALEQDARVLQIQLAPLSRQDTRELIADTLQRDQVPSTLMNWLMAHAQGNPRFTVGLLESFAERNLDIQAPALGQVPEKLAHWIRTELAQLDPPTLTLLELLAVIGDPVDPDDLVRITRMPIENVAAALERLAHAGTVVEQQHEGSLGYTLAHALTQEVLYTDIGGARKRVMHRRVATTLLKSGRTEVATSHYVRAAQMGDSEAVGALIEMTRQAQRRGAGSQAWQIISALQDLLPTGDKRWCQVFDALIQQSNWGIVDRTEHYVADSAALQRMRQLLPGVGNLQRQADVRLWLAGLFAYGAGDFEAGERECQQALALCQQAGRDVAARSAAIELAKIRGWAGDLLGEELVAKQVLSEAKQAGDQRGIAEALGALGHTLGWQGRFDAAEDALLRSVKMARAATHFPWTSQNLTLLASLDACRGHLESARARWAMAATSSPHDDPMIGRCGAFIELLAGDLTMAGAYARQAERHERPARSCVPVRLASLAAMAAAERGALTEADRYLHAMTRTERETLGILEPLYWWAKGVVARAEGRLTTAVAALQRAVERYSAMSAHALRGFILADLAEVTVTAGDCDAAASAARWANDNACHTGAPLHRMLHWLAAAWALIGRGHHEAAARSALCAVEGFSSRGYVLLAARAQLTYATAIRRSDRGAATDALREAAVALEACGAIVRYQQADSLLRQLGSDGRAQRPTRDPGSLTTRERQVAELAAAGFTAAQIAERLHIGVRTVETHLARSYRKVGVTCKQELVHRATELGFISGP